MSSLFNHAFIPISLLFIFSNKLKLDHRKIIILSFFGVFPDADFYIPPHRAIFHNIFILIIPFIIYFLIKDQKISGMIGFYLLSHLILDIFNGGIFFLYPFYNEVIYITASVWISGKGIIEALNYGVNDDIVRVKGGEAIISSESIGTIILFMILASVYIILNRKDIEKNIKDTLRCIKI